MTTNPTRPVPQNRVLVLDKNKVPLMPCHPARAREVLRKGKAAVYRQYPFTIILKDREYTPSSVQPSHLGIDPGAKHTGMAIVILGKGGRKVVYGLELEHRGFTIKQNLIKRAACRRRRRVKNLRYRKPRFDNRKRLEDWLAPSLESRVANITTWVNRLSRYCHIRTVKYEMTSFDTAELRRDVTNSNLYRTTQMRHYLLHRYSAKCQYCIGVSKDKYLQWDHMVPRSKGGTDSSKNATLACRTCNQDKDNLLLKEWLIDLKRKKDPLSKMRYKRVHSLITKGAGAFDISASAAAMNRIKFPTIERLMDLGHRVSHYPSWETAYNRNRLKISKSHWVDAACIGATDILEIWDSMNILKVKATGHGSRQMQGMNKYGFPRTGTKGPSRVHGFKTGDIVKVVVPTGKYKGPHIGRVAVRTSGWFDVFKPGGKITINYKHCTKLHNVDGYSY